MKTLNTRVAYIVYLLFAITALGVPMPSPKDFDRGTSLYRRGLDDDATPSFPSTRTFSLPIRTAPQRSPQKLALGPDSEHRTKRGGRRDAPPASRDNDFAPARGRPADIGDRGRGRGGRGRVSNSPTGAETRKDESEPEAQTSTSPTRHGLTLYTIPEDPNEG